jgi:hypothetical protein
MKSILVSLCDWTAGTAGYVILMSGGVGGRWGDPASYPIDLVTECGSSFPTATARGVCGAADACLSPCESSKEAAGDYFVNRMPGLIVLRNPEAAGERYFRFLISTATFLLGKYSSKS